ncbi:MAG: YCF48-related protein [Candidatus Eremiobacterota bacterium]
MSEITWLHLSDLHILSTSDDTYSLDKVLKALLETIKNGKEKPDFIFITGDIINRGGTDYSKAEKFFDNLLDAAGMINKFGSKEEARRRLFIVPGNHDVDRSKTEFLQRPLNDNNQSIKFFNPKNSENRKPFFERFHAYQEFFNSYFKGIRVFDVDNYYYTELITFQTISLSIGIIGLNSCWFAQGPGENDDEHKLWIGERTCTEAFDDLDKKGKSDLTIILYHHPIAWAHPEEVSIINEVLTSKGNILLYGHIHHNETEDIRNQHGRVLKFQAGSAYGDDKQIHRALWGFIDANASNLTIKPITYQNGSPGTWTIDPSLYKYDTPEHTKTYELTDLVYKKKIIDECNKKLDNISDKPVTEYSTNTILLNQNQHLDKKLSRQSIEEKLEIIETKLSELDNYSIEELQNLLWSLIQKLPEARINEIEKHKEILSFILRKIENKQKKEFTQASLANNVIGKIWEETKINVPEIITTSTSSWKLHNEKSNDFSKKTDKTDTFTAENNLHQPSIVSPTLNIENINKEIKEAVKLIESNQIDKARNQLFIILGKIENNPKCYKEQLMKVYNNLGVCFNIPEIQGGNLQEAEQYIHKALSIAPDSNDLRPIITKAKINLAYLHINKGGEYDLRKAYEISLSLWESSDASDPGIFHIFLWTTTQFHSTKKALLHYEKLDKSNVEVLNNPEILILASQLYLETQNFDKAEELIDLAINLSGNTEVKLYIKAKILINRSQIENIIKPMSSVIPKFTDYKYIEKANRLLEEALKISSDFIFENKIKIDILLCKLWMREFDEKLYRNIFNSIDIKYIDAIYYEQLFDRIFAFELQVKNFQRAYQIAREKFDWENMNDNEKVKIANIFTFYGYPEISKEILKEFEFKPEHSENSFFWLEKSKYEILLNNKHLAIENMKKAKNIAKDTEDKQIIQSNIITLMFRYSHDGETDRLLGELFDYDKKYPNSKILKPIKAITDDGDITEEFKSFWKEQKIWYEDTIKLYKENYVISYMLEKIFKRTYADILSFQKDPRLTIDFTIMDEKFETELLSNLEEGKNIVFDYASLLNLSKMKFLSLLDKFGKFFYITRSLFNKIQQELLTFEHEDLRNLWDFLRKSKIINIIDDAPAILKCDRKPDLLDEWLIDTMRLAKAKNAILLTDDFRLLRLIRYENIKVCNSFIMLKFIFSKKWIDEKVFSLSIGDLAERFYIFLPFNGENLFHIVMEDEAKITPRTYHLVNQIFTPGVIIETFTGVFAHFIDKLWTTGSLPIDKVNWIIFLTNIILEYIDKQIQDNIKFVGRQINENIEFIDKICEFATQIVQWWKLTIDKSNKEELELIKNSPQKISSRNNFIDISSMINKIIMVKNNPEIRNKFEEWKILNSGTLENLHAVHFVDENTGWVAGNKGVILKTIDGGNTWLRQRTGITTTLLDIYFIDNNIGWAVGVQGMILCTINGGITWNIQRSNVPDQICGIYFIDSVTGWCAGGNKILHTTNGGNTWDVSEIKSQRLHFTSIHFVNELTGWVVGNDGMIFNTSDGGKKWIEQSLKRPNTFYGVYFINEKMGWILGNGGLILYTENGGNTWSSQEKNKSSRELEKIYFLSNQLQSVYFTSKNIGWTVGHKGTILNTTDGGKTWNAIDFKKWWNSFPEKPPPDLYDVYFSEIFNGWIVGAGGTIIKYCFHRDLFNTATTNNFSEEKYMDKSNLTEVKTASRNCSENAVTKFPAESVKDEEMKKNKDNLPCVVILTALSLEYKAVQEQLNELEEVVIPSGIIYEIGLFPDVNPLYKVAIAEIGMGNIESALATQNAIKYFSPNVLLFVGIAGGTKDVNLGDVVASTDVYSYEYGKVQENFKTRPKLGNSSRPLIHRARAEARKGDWLKRLRRPYNHCVPRVFIGPIAAGEKVIAESQSELYRFIRNSYNDALAVDMEGFGMLKAAHDTDQTVNVLVIRGISDLIDKKEETDSSGFQKIAAENASAFAFEVLYKLNPARTNL